MPSIMLSITRRAMLGTMTTDTAAKVRDNRLRRAAARAGLTLTKNRQTQLWHATRTTSRGSLRIVSPAHGLDPDALSDWLDDYREATS